MADKVKSPTLILVVLILLSLFLAGGVFYLLQKEKAKSLSLQAELEDAKITQKITETKLTESRRMISQLEIKLREAQNQIDTLTQDLEQEKTARQQASNEIEQLKTELEQQKKSRSDTENKLILAQEDMKKIQAQLKTLDSKKTALEAKIKDLETQLQQAQTKNVELGTIVVAPETPMTDSATAEAVVMPSQEKPTAPAEGKILVVNKDYNFAVINLGNKDEVRVGDIFGVYHNNQYVGDIKIDKVHDSMSAAGFTSMDIKDKINEGDKVVQKTR